VNTVISDRRVTTLFSAAGGVGRMLDRRAAGVTERARANVTGAGPDGRPHVRSGQLSEKVRYELREDARGLVALIGTDPVSPRGNFPYAKALERGMPEYAPLPGKQSPYQYPFLKPALEAEFGR
jgi:hypothetical protein